MSILPVWMSACLSASLPACGIKHTSGTRPGACDTSLEPSRQKKSIHEKKIPLRAPARPWRAKTCYAHYISYLKANF